MGSMIVMVEIGERKWRKQLRLPFYTLLKRKYSHEINI